MCFIHSMTSKTNTHGPGENHMSTGFTVEGYPSAGAWVSYALGSECDNLPAFVAIPDPRGVPQVGPNNWSSGFLPAVFQGTVVQCPAADRNLATPAELAAERSARRAISSSCSTTSTWSAIRATASWRRGSPATNWRPSCSSARRKSATCRARPRPRMPAMAPTTPTRSRPASPAIACWPGGCWSAACASCSSLTAPTRWARAWAIGTATRRSRRSTKSTPRFSISRPRRC